MKVKGFYPQFDFPDWPPERVALDISKDLIASSCDKRDGIVIRYPDLHAAGIELGIWALQRFAKLKEWAPYPGPPIFLVLSLGYEKACEAMGWTEEDKAPAERPIKNNDFSRPRGSTIPKS